jgi:sigma-B regulation protein RsbU (phosphoserine phosphatase)
MKDKQMEILEERIHKLELELAEREKDLGVFRKELEKANQKLEGFLGHLTRELKVMAQIQKTLVPTEFPNIPGFEFSTKFVSGRTFGGDYFDIFEHEDKFRFGVVMAHSSGFSVSALLLSVLLKLTGQIEARRGTPPQQVMQSLCKELQPSLQNQDHAHVFYGMIDRRNFDLTYCSLGQSVGLHYAYGSGRLQRLENMDQPISKDLTETPVQRTISLNPRDRLILCTEGILKVQNKAGEEFGEERLYRAILGAPRVGVHELRNEILYQAHQFADQQEPEQDLTVLVLEVRDRVIKLAKER